MTTMHKTVLNDLHIEAGAKMVPFAGWEMPVQYQEGILAEHKHTREAVSIFDICHMGEFSISGTDSAQQLDYILARPVLDQKVGSCRYNFLLNEDGYVIDDLIVYRLDEHDFFIVVNAGTKDGDADCFRKRLSDSCKFTDKSDETAKIDLQGPKSLEVLQEFGFNAEELPKYYHWIQTSFDGKPCLLSRTGYTGELGFELYISVDDAATIWRKLSQHPLVKPAGLGARDTLRLEMGYALYGHELDLNTTPVDAGYGSMLKLDSDRAFIGSEVLKKMAPKKRLIGIAVEGRRAAREGTEVRFNDSVVGKVTSGAFSPSLNQAVALAYINADISVSVGEQLQLPVGRTTLDGVVAELPFYKKGTARNKI